MLRRACFYRPTAAAAAATATTAASTLTASTRALSAPGMDFLLNPTPEHKMLRETVSRFAKERLEPQVAEFDAAGKFNRDLFTEFGGLGLFGLTIPEKDGGVGMDATASVIVHHELCKYDVGFCLAYLAHAMLFVNNFYWSATGAQRAKYLPKCLTGETMGAMGMTEPCAGTDVLGMKSTAKKVDGGYRLNGSKTFITNGPHADVFVIYARNIDKKCITSFIVERAWKGFASSPKIDKLGNRTSEMCTLFFDDIFVPEENVLGGPENTNGLVGMMRNLELERVSGAGMSCGMGERCVEVMLKYANEREAFGKKINQFGQIQRHVAECFAEMEAAKALTYSVARNVSPGNNNRLGSDAAKLVAGPAAKRAADSAMQVLGGIGYCKAMPVERLWRDSKLCDIGAGTIESHHKNLTKDLTSLL